MAEIDSRSQPVFLLSCNRAGSTLLRFILDTHPDIYCPPELFLGQAASSLSIFLYGLEGPDSYVERSGRLVPGPVLLDPIRDLLSGRLAEHTARRGKRVWCEKTPDNLAHLELVEDLFPNARHICLHRHCLDVAASASRMVPQITALHRYIVESRGHVLTGIILWWNDMTRGLLELERTHPDRCYRIRYEDLVQDPARVLPPLFAFLGVDWEERLLEAVFTSHHDRGIEDRNIRFTRKIHGASLGAGASLDLSEVPQDVVAEMRRLLAELGYPEAIAKSPDGSSLPAPEISPAWVFETHLQQRLQAEPETGAAAGSTYRFVVDGPEGGSWLVDLRQTPGRVIAGGEDALCTIGMSEADLTGVALGTLNARKLFREGRVRLEGAIQPEALQNLVLLLLVEAEPSRAMA